MWLCCSAAQRTIFTVQCDGRTPGNPWPVTPYVNHSTATERQLEYFLTSFSWNRIVAKFSTCYQNVNPAALSINNSVVVSVSRGDGMQTNEFTCQNKWVIVFLSCISNYDIHNYMIYPECIMGPHNQVKYCFALTYHSVVKSFWNFAQSTAVSAPNFVPLEVRKWFDNRNGCSGQKKFC